MTVPDHHYFPPVNSAPILFPHPSPFEYAPEHATLFEELVAALRESAEWRYVEREVDVRMTREPG